MRYIKVGLVIALCLVLSGCFVCGKNWSLGQGKAKYYPDGKVKEIESTFLPKLIDFSIFKAEP